MILRIAIQAGMTCHFQEPFSSTLTWSCYTLVAIPLLPAWSASYQALSPVKMAQCAREQRFMVGESSHMWLDDGQGWKATLKGPNQWGMATKDHRPRVVTVETRIIVSKITELVLRYRAADAVKATTYKNQKMHVSDGKMG